MLYLLIGHFRSGASATRSQGLETPLSEPTHFTYVGSWVEATLRRSFLVVDCDDVATLQRWAACWRHRVEFEVVPIVAARDAIKALEPLLEN